MRSRRGRSHRRGRGAAGHGEDEASGLAGWVYTDLLLGLAVVFLGAITLVITAPAIVGGADDDTDEESSPAETTTTTSTLPPEICTILYQPAAASDQGIRVDLNSAVGDAQLALDFRNRLTERLDAENAQIDRTQYEPFVFDELRIGIVIVLGAGPDSASGARRSTETTNRLRALFPDLFEGTVLRAFWQSGDRTSANVRVEVFPTLTGECGVLARR